jgi:hypothetical protein
MATCCDQSPLTDFSVVLDASFYTTGRTAANVHEGIVGRWVQTCSIADKRVGLAGEVNRLRRVKLVFFSKTLFLKETTISIKYF